MRPKTTPGAKSSDVRLLKPSTIVRKKSTLRSAKPNPTYRTRLGSMYLGEADALLGSKHFDKFAGKIQLIFTSPPFPLKRQKKYGNLSGQAYIDWLSGYAKTFRNLLTKDGSAVLEIGNSWETGQPVMSTTVLRALLAFLEKSHFYLCQEFIWYNPARLPSPAQWVNVERIRVKDAFTRIWWMSSSQYPKADNTRILQTYSQSMQQLLRTQNYNAGKRPSEHRIGKGSFLKNNGGAIPSNVLNSSQVPSLSNLLKVSNTRPPEQYHQYCDEKKLLPHPARMPEEIPEFFLKFLTEPGDLVLDPFAGSNTTGYVAERLNRRWLSLERDKGYARGSKGRFDPKLFKRKR